MIIGSRQLVNKHMKFIILSEKRCGSTVLLYTLGRNLELKLPNYEPFNWHRPLEDALPAYIERNSDLYNIYGEKPTYDDFSFGDKDLSEYVRFLFTKWDAFNIKTSNQINNPATWETLKLLSRTGDIKVIFLYRQNKLDQYISLQLAAQTDIWHIAQEESEIRKQLRKTKIHLYIGDMLKTMETWESQESEFMDRFPEPECLHLSYDMLNRNWHSFIQKAAGFLGASIPTHKQYKCKRCGRERQSSGSTPVFVKNNVVPHWRRVKNYSDVEEALYSSKRTQYLPPIKRRIEIPSGKTGDKCVFTIMSGNYLANSLVTLSSMKRFDESASYWIVICDDMPSLSVKNRLFKGGYNLLHRTEIFPDDAAVHQVVDDSVNLNAMRWRMKPVAFAHFLQSYKRIIYIDNDCFFLKEFDFLFDDLTRFGILLTPHWRSIYPIHELNFKGNFSHGIFNAGFVGISDLGAEPLSYWFNACTYRCECNYAKGFFVDQKYLDLVPVMFPDVCKIVEHRGCNVAVWNKHLNVRKVVQRQLIINDKWPLIFVHLSHWTGDKKNLGRYHRIYQTSVNAWEKRLESY